MIEYQEPQRITEQMKAGLVRLYSDGGIRAYMENAINIQNQNIISAMKAGKPDVALEYTIRLDTLQKLMEKGKSLFNDGKKNVAEPLSALEEVKL